MNQEVYAENPFKGSNSAKYHATNVTTVPTDHTPLEHKRLEYRPVRAQESVEGFILDAGMLDARIRWLERELAQGKFPEFINPVTSPDPQDHVALARRFRAFIEETGLPWAGPGGYQERARTGPWGDAVDQATCIQAGVHSIMAPL